MEKKKEPAENEESKIEKILDKKIKKERTYYLVKWLGNDETTWEPEENLDNYVQLVEEYNSNNNNNYNNNPLHIDSKSMQLKLNRNKEKKNNNERKFTNLNSETIVGKTQEEILDSIENELLKLDRKREKLICDKIKIHNSNSKNNLGKVIDDKYSEKEFSFKTQEEILDRIESELLKLDRYKEKLIREKENNKEEEKEKEKVENKNNEKERPKGSKNDKMCDKDKNKNKEKNRENGKR